MFVRLGIGTASSLARCCAIVALLVLGIAKDLPAEAATGPKVTKHASKSKVQAKNKKKPARRLSARAAAAKAKAEARRKSLADAIAAGKAAVFVFDGDETEALRTGVVRLLKANGMRVRTDLRPNDTAVQFRDMAAALKLAIYVHGRVVNLPGGRSLVTIAIRSGVTGQNIASASFRGERRELPSMVEQGLWDKVKAPVGRTCVLALKPRRHSAPMRIEAGTPIEDTPRSAEGS
jgi:hypothetical protein